jgi:hypothetical protein
VRRLTPSLKSPIAAKLPSRPLAVSESSCAPHPHAQVAISRAEGLVRSARSHVFEVLGEAWATLIRGDSLSSNLRASYHVANTNAHRSCTEAVDLLYKANGGSSVYARGPLDRCFRDIHTISQHTGTSLSFDEKAGQVLLGLEPVDQIFWDTEIHQEQPHERQRRCDTVRANRC